MEEKCLDYNFLLNDMGCEESVEASMSIQPRKIMSQKQRTISTYPSIEDLVKKEKRKQIADNMKLRA